MPKSPEYLDLEWVVPRSWRNANRTSVQVVVIHTTEGSSHGQSAEDGAAYDARRTDGTSTHYFHDSNSTVQCVRTEDVAYTARTTGNRIGIQHELCARAGSQDWDSSYSRALLEQAARQCARDVKKWDIPVRKLTPSQVRAGARGFCGHVDITNAFPEDNGTHTDPGRNFPWDRFLDMVRAYLAPKNEEDEEMDFWASAAKAARGDADATATDRNNRNNAVQVIRFAFGLQVDEQTTDNLPSGPGGQLDRVEEALAKLSQSATK